MALRMNSRTAINGLLRWTRPPTPRIQARQAYLRSQLRFQSSGPRGSPGNASQAQPAQAEAATGTTHAPSMSAVRSSGIVRALNPLGAPFRAYGRAQDRRPLVTQFCTTVAIFFLGDLSSQYFLRNSKATKDESEAGEAEDVGAPKSFSETYSPIRSLHAVIIGGIAAIPMYHWFMYLGRHFNAPASVPQRWKFAATLSLRTVANQVLWAPFFNVYFFGMSVLLSNPLKHSDGSVTDYLSQLATLGNVQAAAVRVQDTLLVSWLNSCRFWPVVTAFSFTFVPPQHRSAFAGVVAVGWQTYLGMVNQRAAALEAERARQRKGLASGVSAQSFGGQGAVKSLA